MSRFTDKRILITGATSGIGRAGAERAAAEGAELVLTGTDRQRITELGEAIPGARVVSNDAGDPAAVEELAGVVENAGPLDGLWLNAGYADVAPVDRVDAEFFDRMMAANVRGPVLQLARLAPHLNDGASVLVTSSTAAYAGESTVAVYAATKGAIAAAARAWASELAPRGIRVNTLVPGPIATRFRDFMPEEQRDQFEAGVVAGVPLGRVGSSEEAAAVALFLLSDEASYVTSSEYAVDGGLVKR